MTNCTADDSNIWHVSICDLPDEILINIFSHLSFNELLGLQKVCARWKMLSQRAELWIDKEYEIGISRKSDSDTCKYDEYDVEAIQTLCNAPNLRKIRFWRPASFQVFRALYTKCHRLTELHLDSRQKLTYSELKNLVENCRKIHTLKIRSDMLKSQEFAEVVSQLQYLRVLELINTGSTPCLRPLCDGCPQLSEVDFRLIHLDVDDLRHFLNAKRNTLKSIRIMCSVNKRCVVPLLTVCAGTLESLEIEYYDVVDDAREAFTALGRLKNLQKLTMSIREPPPPGATPLAFKSGGLPKLKQLILRAPNHMESETIIAIFHGCPALRELVFRYIDIISDAAFSEIHCLTNLKILDVTACHGFHGALIPYLARLPQLHTLTMGWLKFPTLEPGMSSILDLSGLRYLRLNYSVVTGVPFAKFPGKLINLRELHIQGCRGDSKTTDMLAEMMPDLQIHGKIFDIVGHETDEDNVEEENEEQGGPGDADAAYDDSPGRNSDSDCEEDGGSDCEHHSESDGKPDDENYCDDLWGESHCVTFLLGFLVCVSSMVLWIYRFSLSK